MPPHKHMKTYQRKTRIHMNKITQSADALNALLAQNLTKRFKSRRKRKLKIRELSPRTETCLSDDSLEVDVDDTFDKILKGNIYNEVKVTDFNNVKVARDGNSKLQISTVFHSPIITRKRRKAYVAIIEDSSLTNRVEKSSTLDKPVTSSLSSDVDIFDKILKGNSYNEAKVTDFNNVKVASGSGSKLQISTSFYTTPVMTRRMKKAYVAITQDSSSINRAQKSSTLDKPVTSSLSSDVDTSDKILKGNSYNEAKVTDFNNVKVASGSGSKLQISTSFYTTPVMTRRMRKAYVAITQDSSLINRAQKSSTLDKPVTSSLSIEKENKGLSKSHLSYIKLPNIAENKEVGRLDVSYKPIFSDTFREKQAVHSSTPCISEATQKIVEDPLSPITKSDSSTSSKLLEKSYIQIQTWDEKFPEIESKNTPRKKSLGKIKGRRRKLSTIVDEETKKHGPDWKLNCQPKVYLKPSDLINSKRKSRLKSTNEIPDLLGFSEEEQSSSSKESFRIKSWLKSIEGSTRKKKSLPALKYDPRKSSRNSLKKNNYQRNSQTSNRTTARTLHSNSKRKSSVKNDNSRKKSTTPKLCTVASEDKHPYITLRKRPLCHPVKIPKKNMVSSGRKSKIKKDFYINVTADILSEKEVSYSNSGSFDFSSSSSSSKIKDTTEELKQDKEVVIPKTAEGTLTVSLEEFDNFMESYYQKEKEAEEKLKQEVVVLVEPIKEKEVAKLTTESKPSEKNDLQSVISPGNSNTMPNTSQKIIILSDISLGQNYNIVSRKRSLENIVHDHSYSNSPTVKPNETNSPSILDVHDYCLSDIIESSIPGDASIKKIAKKVEQKPIRIKPGKSYRRSLSLLRRSSILVDVKNSVCHRDCVCLKCLFKTKLGAKLSRRSQIVPVSKNDFNDSVLKNYARSSLCYVQSEEDYVNNLDDSVRSLSLNESRRTGGIVFDENLEDFEVVTAKEVVLRRCGQTKILPFEECYPRSALQHCQKIGEGVYGEVFLYRNQNGGTTVMKIIPIEGDLIVNGERQKKFEEILSEIVIAMELSNLRDNKKNTTYVFSEVQKIRCTQGSYPDRLLDLWELYDETKGSENDSPQMFPPNQCYIVLELSNGGTDLESFVFANAQQVFSMFKQTACALAVAESELKFEHRDLHWGNILINTVDKTKVLRYRLDGKEIEVDSLGVEVTIIDFTLSRMEFEGVVIYNDLSRDDELFVAQGDYQFEIYRLMQKSNGNEWQHFEPYTNILWLHYLLDKVSALRYKNPRSKLHKAYLEKLQTLKDQVLSFNSVVDFVKDKFI